MGDRCRNGLVALDGERHAKRIRGKGLGRVSSVRCFSGQGGRIDGGTMQSEARDWWVAGSTNLIEALMGALL